MQADQHLSQNVSRRGFVKTSAGVALAAAAGGFPSILRAEDKSGSKPMILGADDHQYQLIQDWAKLPPNIQFGKIEVSLNHEEGVQIHYKVSINQNWCRIRLSSIFVRLFTSLHWNLPSTSLFTKSLQHPSIDHTPRCGLHGQRVNSHGQ